MRWRSTKKDLEETDNILYMYKYILQTVKWPQMQSPRTKWTYTLFEVVKPNWIDCPGKNGVALKWVPGHIGVKASEIADVLAKLSSEKAL